MSDMHIVWQDQTGRLQVQLDLLDVREQIGSDRFDEACMMLARRIMRETYLATTEPHESVTVDDLFNTETS